MNKLLMLTSYAKLEFNSWRNNEITINQITNYRHFASCDIGKLKNDVIFKQWL